MSLRQRVLSFGLPAIALCGASAVSLSAQQPVTREQAVAAALARGARAAFGRADTAAASGALHAARLYPNPTALGSYSRDVPHYHVTADLPLDLPWIRSARIGAAASARDAARYNFAFERAAIRFDVDTAYTRALAALARARLSRRNALDADSLRKMAQLRREVGDVSELDVRLAAVNAGQLENVAADDSVAGVQALVAVQLAMGLASERALTLAHRSLFAAPSLQVGFDNGDPGGQRGLLPMVGLSLPLPLFNWNGGEVRQAAAARDRAQASLDLVRRETGAEQARVRRGFALALVRLERDRGLLSSADRVAAMSLQAYAEGAIPLANVLEAHRNAREALGRYIDDVAAANNAAAAVRLLAATDQP